MTDFAEYRSSLCSLRSMLGIGCLHIWEDDVLMPYITRILSDLNEKMLLEGKETLEDNVAFFIEYYREGMSKILGSDEDYKELVERYGYDINDPNFVCRYFVAAWVDIMKTIYMTLLYNYPELFTTQAIDCHECCGSVQTDSNGNSFYTPNVNNLKLTDCGCGRKG